MGKIFPNLWAWSKRSKFAETSTWNRFLHNFHWLLSVFVLDLSFCEETQSICPGFSFGSLWRPPFLGTCWDPTDGNKIWLIETCHVQTTAWSVGVPRCGRYFLRLYLAEANYDEATMAQQREIEKNVSVDQIAVLTNKNARGRAAVCQWEVSAENTLNCNLPTETQRKSVFATINWRQKRCLLRTSKSASFSEIW